MKKSLLFLVCCLGFSVGKAQQWKNYTSSVNVNCLKIDNDTIWIGSDGGVAKYLTNGTQLETFTKVNGLAANYVTSIAVDMDGNKWFGTGRSDRISNGVSKFDGTNWTTYNPYNSGLGDSVVNGILIDKFNNKWFFTQSAYYKFDGINWTAYSAADSALVHGCAPMTDSHGNTWLGLSKYNGINLTKYQLPNFGFTIGGISGYAMDSHDNLWVGAYVSYPGTNGGLFKFDGVNWYNYSDSIGGWPITQMMIDKHDNLWLGNYSCVYKYNSLGIVNYCYNYSDTNSLSPGQVSSITIDSSDNLWVGSWNNVAGAPGLSVSKFDGVNWAHYNPSNSGLLHNFIYSIATDKHNNVWVGGWTGIQKFNSTSWSRYALEQSNLTGDISNSIFITKDDIAWFSGTNGVYKFDGSNFSYSLYDFCNIQYVETKGVVVDDLGNVWCGTQGCGLGRLVNNTWTEWWTGSSQIANDNISCLALDAQGNKWIGTIQSGVSKFDGTNWTTYTSINSGLADNSIYSIAIDMQGNVWFGTNKGVSKFNGTAWSTYNILNSGLPGNLIYSIAIDKAGNKWFATFDNIGNKSKGVTKFDDTNWTTYNFRNSGLADNTVRAISVDEQNNVWFGTTSNGVSELLSPDITFSVGLHFNENVCSNNTITLNTTINYGTPPYTFAWQATGNSLSCNNCEHPTATITQNSVFIVAVTDSNNNITADTLHVYACLNTAVNEISAENSITIFPNPATNLLNISIDESLIGAQLNIYNVTGSLVQTVLLSTANSQLSTGNLPNGVYIAEIKTKEARVMRRWVKM